MTTNEKICGSRTQVWTEDRVDRLKDGIARKLSARQIGIEIGVSRSAVIGKISRIGLALANSVSLSLGAARTRARRNGGAVVAGIKAAHKRKVARISAIARLTAATVTLAPEPTACRPVALLDLRDEDCRWPIGEPGEEGFGFCAAPRRDNTVSYCDAHCRVSHQQFRTISESERERRRQLGKSQVARGAWSCGFSTRGETCNGLRNRD